MSTPLDVLNGHLREMILEKLTAWLKEAERYRDLKEFMEWNKETMPQNLWPSLSELIEFDNEFDRRHAK